MNQEKTKEKPLEVIREIAIKQIRIGDDNVRHTDPTRDLDELAASIREHGLLHPVVLKGEYGTPPYELVSGQRRFLAYSQILRRSKIPAVFAGKLSKTAALVRSLVENLQRVELEYGDTADAVTHLYRQFDKDVDEVHRVTGLSVRKVRDFILIDAQATPKMKTLLRHNKVSVSDVKRVIRAAQDDLDKAEELLDLIVKYQPTSHQKRRLVMFGEKRTGASAKNIFEEALKPHIEENIIINLSDELRAALLRATKSLSMEPEELAAKALSEWLRRQGFSE